MSRIFKYIGFALIGISFLLACSAMTMRKKMPASVVSPEAAQLVDKMYSALNKPAWDSTDWVKWTSKGGHHFVWDKRNGRVQVKWSDHVVMLHTGTQKGTAMSNGQMLHDEAADQLVLKAWKLFCNDSFWFIAPFKATDSGTTQSVVTNPDGTKSLMVQYGSGGVTPGDTYLWKLDTNGVPVSWQMWVKILPIGGIEATWYDWQTLPTGAKVAGSRKLPLINVATTDLDAGFGPAPF